MDSPVAVKHDPDDDEEYVMHHDRLLGLCLRKGPPELIYATSPLAKPIPSLLDPSRMSPVVLPLWDQAEETRCLVSRILNVYLNRAIEAIEALEDKSIRFDPNLAVISFVDRTSESNRIGSTRLALCDKGSLCASFWLFPCYRDTQKLSVEGEAMEFGQGDFLLGPADKYEKISELDPSHIRISLFRTPPGDADPFCRRSGRTAAKPASLPSSNDTKRAPKKKRKLEERDEEVTEEEERKEENKRRKIVEQEAASVMLNLERIVRQDFAQEQKRGQIQAALEALERALGL